MINTVIFDLDGLLIDSEVTWYQVTRNLVGEFGIEFTKAEYLEKYSGKTVADNIAKLIEKYQLPLQYEDGVQRLIDAEARFVENGIPLKAGAKELLEYLKENNYKIVLGTSSVRERANKLLEGNQVDRYFDDIVVGYDVERGKPFPDVFLAAAAKVDAKPEECLVLEDSEMGIQAAFAANIPVICVPDMKLPKEEFVDMTAAILPSLLEVIEFLENRK